MKSSDKIFLFDNFSFFFLIWVHEIAVLSIVLLNILNKFCCNANDKLNDFFVVILEANSIGRWCLGRQRFSVDALLIMQHKGIINIRQLFETIFF